MISRRERPLLACLATFQVAWNELEGEVLERVAE